jgi:hypothetical protein
MVLDLVARMENMRREFEEEMARREEEMAGEIQRLRQRAAAASE